MADLEGRVAALEDEAVERERLAQGVERLSGSVGDLNDVLAQVDEQQRRLAALNARTGQIESTAKVAARKAEQTAFTVEERAATAQVERRMFLRRVYATTAAALLVAVCSVIGGAWVTDAHLQNCVIHGPNSDSARRLCNATFPGHDHPEEISLDALLRRGAITSHNQCLTGNKRTQLQIDREEKLASVDGAANAPIHTQSARDLSALLVDCNKTAPLPPPPHH